MQRDIEELRKDLTSGPSADAERKRYLNEPWSRSMQEGSLTPFKERRVVDRALQVVTHHDNQPMTQWGVWDCGILHLNVYDWARETIGELPGRGNTRTLERVNGLGQLLDLMKGHLVLQERA